jgi:hypothetical protein
MAKKDKKFKIEALMSGNPPVHQLTLRNENGHVIGPTDPIPFNKSNDGMKKVDHYRIRFELQNPNQTNLRFVDKVSDAMWCHTLAACPNSPCEMPGVFWVDAIDNDRKWVDVINMDLTVQEFRFTLNLVDRNIVNPTQADYVPLDPIGDNQDRGSAGSTKDLSVAAAIIVGIVAGLAAFAGANLLLTG